MPALIVFAAGLLFSVGLALAGMTQPQKVIGFLDFFGDWDPSLAFVMAGAIVTYGGLFPLVTRRKGPVFASLFRIPDRRDITPSLVGGAAVFGVGWGLGGFCPGPALASIPTGGPMVLVFLGAMFAAMGGYAVYESFRDARRATPPRTAPDAPTA